MTGMWNISPVLWHAWFLALLIRNILRKFQLPFIWCEESQWGNARLSFSYSSRTSNVYVWWGMKLSMYNRSEVTLVAVLLQAEATPDRQCVEALSGTTTYNSTPLLRGALRWQTWTCRPGRNVKVGTMWKWPF